MNKHAGYKVGNLVKVKRAFIDANLMGKVVPITKISDGKIWVDGSQSYWVINSDFTLGAYPIEQCLEPLTVN